MVALRGAGTVGKSLGPAAPDSLRAVEIFRSLSDQSLARIAARSQCGAYGAGEEIVPYLDERDDVYFLLSGRARVMIYSISGKAVAFRDIEQGGLFGEYAAIDQRPRSARVEARAETIAARLPAEDFRAAIRTEPCLMEAVMRHLVGQVRDLTSRVFEFSTLAVKGRIQAELLRLAGNPGPDTATCRISPFPTHADFAVHVSTHREAVTREISRLVRLGVVRRAGHALEICDVPRLIRMVEDAGGE